MPVQDARRRESPALLTAPSLVKGGLMREHGAKE